MNWTIYYCKVVTKKESKLFLEYNLCSSYESSLGITARTKKEAWEYGEQLMKELGPEYKIKAIKPNYEDAATLIM